jgi:AcrR family transcriptional regulator
MMARKGFKATTLPAIAEAANVSPRTVSTYFPSKENIVFQSDGSPMETMRQYLDERGPEESVLDALQRWMIHRLYFFELPQARMRRHIIDQAPRLQALERHRALEGERIIAIAVAAELGMSPDDLEPRIIAAAAAGALAVPRIRAELGHSPSRADSIDALDRVFAFLRAGVAAYAPRPLASAGPGPSTDGAQAT